MKRHPLRVLLLCLLFCATCEAQGITPTAQTVGRGGAESSQPRAYAAFGLPTRTFRGNVISWERAGGTVSAPALLRDSEKLFVFGGLSYLRMRDRDRTLPPRLVRLSAGAFGIFDIDDVRVTVGLTGVYQGDGDRITWDTFDLALTLAVQVPLNDEWTLTPGLRVSTGVNGPGNIFRYIPLPSLSATYTPNDDFTLTIGLGDFYLRWRQSRWFTVEAAYFPIYSGQLRISHEVTDWLTIREFIGRYNEAYVLTGQRWPDNHGLYLNTWSAGVTADAGFDLSGGERPPQLGISATYAFGFGGKVRAYNYKRAKELFEHKLQPGHAFMLAVSVRF